MKQLIEDIVRSLVDIPEEVQIKEVVGDHAHVLELRVGDRVYRFGKDGSPRLIRGATGKAPEAPAAAPIAAAPRPGICRLVV